MNTENVVPNKVLALYLALFYLWWTVEELANWDYTVIFCHKSY